MKPLDLVDAHRVASLAVTPDGARIVYTHERPSLRADAYTSQLWSVGVEGDKPRRLTRGRRDFAPQVSPDGTRVAFLRAAGGPPQLHVMRLDGGEPFAVTAQPIGVEAFAWAPDSRRLAFVARQPHAGRYGTAAGVTPDAEPARRITSPRYRWDGIGYEFDRPGQLFVVEVPEEGPELWLDEVPTDGYDLEGHAEPVGAKVPDAVQLTTGDLHRAFPAFSEDGSEVFAVVVEGPVLSGRVEAWAADGSAESPRLVLDESARLQILALLSHGGQVWLSAVALGEGDVEDFVGRSAGLFRVGADGSGLTALTAPDTIDLGEPGTVLVAAPQGGVLSQNRVRGSLQIVHVSDDGTVTTLAEGAHDVRALAVGGDTVAAAVARADALEEAAVLRDGILAPLTDLSATLRSRGVTLPQERVYTAPDGTPVHGWVLVPEGEGPHPTLLLIHGGPHAQYTASFFDEAQVYTGAGYAVVMCNPRGSAGYGEEAARSVKGCFGTVDRDDVMAFLEGAVAEFDELDGDRLGIMGGSYGGYMTAWVIAQDHRFRGAIVERGYLDPLSTSGPCDIGWFFNDAYLGTDRDQLIAQSPMARVDDVRTPTLVIHSENDIRCPIEAAQRYHDRLQRNGVTTSFLVFPGESHGLTRNGRPRHRVQRFQAVLEWWAEFLPIER